MSDKDARNPKCMSPFVHLASMAWLIGALTLLVLAACGSMGGSTQAPTLVNQYGISIPAVPTLNPSQVARGKLIYKAHCERCHGVNGVGAPNWKVPDANLNFPPPPQDDSGHTWHHADRILYEAIRDGLGDPQKQKSELGMPAFGKLLSEADMRAVIEYFKSLWNREHREFQWLRTSEDVPPSPTPGTSP